MASSRACQRRFSRLPSSPIHALLSLSLTTGSSPTSLLVRAQDDPLFSSSSSDNSESEYHSGPLSSEKYYYVFIAIIICVAGLVLFFYWRRRTRRDRGFLPNGSPGRRFLQSRIAGGTSGAMGDGGQPPGSGFRGVEMNASSRRRYFQGRWRGGEEDGEGGRGIRLAEEGLNERGEAPPPYQGPLSTLAKSELGEDDSIVTAEGRSRSEVSTTTATTTLVDTRQNSAAIATDGGSSELRLPSPTLLRDDFGVKPPDYIVAVAAERTGAEDEDDDEVERPARTATREDEPRNDSSRRS